MINQELRSRVARDGILTLWLEETPVSEPAYDELLVKVEAAPLNPSDQIQMFGPADMASLREIGSPEAPKVEGRVPLNRLAAIAGRLDQSLAVGSEGAGTVVAAGEGARALIGKTVAIRGAPGVFARYQTVKAKDALVLPEGVSARDGAAAFINPLTALGMVETVRREGHSALVHTAAASNLGQMLNRLCLADAIPLVNIVRSAEQAALLRDQGAVHVLNSSAPGYDEALLKALEETDAALAFDAIGGGTMAASLLTAMEVVATRRLAAYSRYGSSRHKQVYIYGALDPSPRMIDGPFGSAWSVGGWLMTWFYERIGPEGAARLRRRAAAELTTTFGSQFSSEANLKELLSLEVIEAYTRRATGAKYLVVPQRERQ